MLLFTVTSTSYPGPARRHLLSRDEFGPCIIV